VGTASGAAANPIGVVGVESVANILERESRAVTEDWYSRVELETDLRSIPLNFEERTRHLPQLLHEVVARLRQDPGSKASVSKAASIHGGMRRTQGYTAAMTIQESRLLQVTIFSMLHRNVRCLDFATLLPDVAIIADEVDAQLKQQMLRFMAV
jgi:RsbT co-antagonist protein rsbRD N-terminal domain